jgi:phosphoglycerol transferase MdoB-like AlkP superfamily enzyme
MASLLIWAFSRLCLYFFNPALFGDFARGELWRIIIGGLRFDFSGLIMFNLPFIMLNVFPVPIREHRTYRLVRFFAFLIPNTIGITLNLADSAYFPFSGKRLTGDIFNYMKAGGGDFINLIPQYLLDFWYATILLLTLPFLFAWLFFTFNRKLEGRIDLGFALKQLGTFLLWAAISVLAIRGGFQLKPVHIITAGQYASPANVPLVLNTPFSIVKTLGNREISEVSYFKDTEAMQTSFNPSQQLMPLPKPDSVPESTMNVVVIILESFSTEHIGSMCYQTTNKKEKPFTPFLDSLSRQSLSYSGFANGKRSIEGIPAILASLPTLMNNDFITSSFSGNSFNSLASILKPMGYTTAFYHGGNNGTMNFDDFAKMAGFEKYYGRDEYDNDKDYDGKWGIYDEPFLQYFALNLAKTKQPFCAAVFTLTSHHPYPIPAQYKGKFPKGDLPIEESIAYTDYALKQFFHTASKQPYFHNTLFVITADHTSESHDDFYKTRAGMYSVPVIFYHPGKKPEGRKAGPVQQTDIMPSVLHYLGYGKPFVAFGTSVFDQENEGFAISFLSGSYLFLQGDYALIFDGVEVKAVYNLKSDPMQRKNLLNQHIVQLPVMEKRLKAIVQQYNNRMIRNELLP